MEKLNKVTNSLYYLSLTEEYSLDDSLKFKETVEMVLNKIERQLIRNFIIEPELRFDATIEDQENQKKNVQAQVIINKIMRHLEFFLTSVYILSVPKRKSFEQKTYRIIDNDVKMSDVDYEFVKKEFRRKTKFGISMFEKYDLILKKEIKDLMDVREKQIAKI